MVTLGEGCHASQQPTGASTSLTMSISGPDYSIGIVGKCLGPTTTKGPTKYGCRIFWTYVSQSVTNGSCIV